MPPCAELALDRVAARERARESLARGRRAPVAPAEPRASAAGRSRKSSSERSCAARSDVDLTPQLVVLGARVGDEGIALRGVARERGLEDRVHRAPPLGRHRRRSARRSRLPHGRGHRLELAAEPHARDGPLATDRRRRDAERRRGFGDAEPREVAQIHQPSLLRIQQREARERVVQRDHVHGVERSPRRAPDSRCQDPRRRARPAPHRRRA